MKKLNIWFIIIFFLIIILPPLTINYKRQVVSKSEKRFLAEKPELIMRDNSINKKYLSEYEAWFNDHIGFRELIISLNAKIQQKLFHKIESNFLYWGKNGEWIPLINFRSFAHTDALWDIKKVTTDLKMIKEYLWANDCQFFYMTAHEKWDIYPEYVPTTINQYGDKSQIDITMDCLSDAGINVVPVKKSLIEGKNKYAVFGRRTDPWHWNPMGSILAYWSFMEKLNQEKNEYNIIGIDEFDISQTNQGFCISGGIPVIEFADLIKVKNPNAILTPEKYIVDLSHPNNCFYSNSKVGNKDTILIIGDSYIREYPILSAIAESFYQTILYNPESMKDDGLIRLIDAYRPKVVLFENAQRNGFGACELAAKSLKKYNYKLGDVLYFNKNNSTGNSYALKGISLPEENFTWTDGNKGILLLNTEPQNEENNTSLDCFLELGWSFLGPQRVIIFVNGIKRYEGNLDRPENISFNTGCSPGEFLNICMEFPDAKSPFSIGHNNDKRQLGIQLISLQLK